MTKWECQDCGNSVESPERPEQCPCGSENIEEVEEPGLVERARNRLGM